MRNYKICIIIVISVIFIDQLSKLLVYYNMEMGSYGEIKILGKWLRLHYTLNPGMAFGIKIGTKYGKLFLTAFRLFATYLIASHLPKLISNKQVSNLLIFGWILILGGAIGNIIDSVFYGIFLNNAPNTAPMRLFYGQVIDMILVGIENIWIPSFVPFVGGRYLPPFPVFNLADSSICTGVSLIILDGLLKKLQPLQRLKQIQSKILKSK